jgi:hypothetical protein
MQLNRSNPADAATSGIIAAFGTHLLFPCTACIHGTASSSADPVRRAY